MASLPNPLLMRLDLSKGPAAVAEESYSDQTTENKLFIIDVCNSFPVHTKMLWFFISPQIQLTRFIR